MTQIGVDAFSHCGAIEAFTVPPENPAYASIDGVLFSKAEKSLLAYPGGSSRTVYSIPENILHIEKNAFSGYLVLRIFIPSTVTSIEEGTFRSGKFRFDVSPDNPCLAVQDEALISTAEHSLIALPAGYFHSSFSVPDGIERISEYAFYFCDSLEKISLPESLVSIGAFAFSNCSRLKQISLPDGITEIEPETFSSCYNLQSIELPDSVIHIGDNAFYRCSSLSEIVLPTGIVSIARKAFQGCSGLTAIVLPDQLECLSEGVFAECEKLTQVTLPQSLKTIEAKAFSGCVKMTEMIIPDGVVSIGEQAFSKCDSLKSVSIPETVNSIGENAFPSSSRLLITVVEGSYAAKYCSTNNLNYTYSDSLDWLNS